MYKIVYNACYGGFSLSKEASEMLNKMKGMVVCNVEYGYIDDEDVVPRHDKDLVDIVEKLGSKRASGDCAYLQVAEIDSNTYRIEEYDGSESIITQDKQNWVVIK